ncbi:MAG: helix-turn-helix domain-containing protein [Syntrophales bacterium]
MTGEEVRKIRQELGVSQTTFAHFLRVSFSTLNRWENGKANPDPDTLKQLKGLEELLNRKEVDKNKVLESLQMVGVASSITLAAASGLIRLPAISGLLGPLGVAAGILASLFLKQALNKKGKTD